MNSSAQISFRSMKPEERPAVKAIMHQSFAWFLRLFFYFTPDTLVAIKDDQVVGAIVLKAFSLPNKKQYGVLCWGFTHPDVRSEGVGKLLYLAGIDALQNQGCERLFGCVEGNNTASSNILANTGFGILSPWQQWRTFGIYTPLLMWHTFHYLDVGHFLWTYPAPLTHTTSIRQWWGTLVANALVALFALSRFMGTKAFSFEMIASAMMAMLIVLGARYIGMKLSAIAAGMKTRYRAWESGFPLSIALAAFFGAIYPVPGSIYPNDAKYHYYSQKTQRGIIAVAGILPLLILYTFSPEITKLIELPSLLRYMPRLLRHFTSVFLIIDVLLPFFPFVSFNGRRVWEWSKVVWITLALLVIAVFIV